MVPHVKFASRDELVLCDDALKNIKALNASIPKENAKIWVTIEEMADRLIHCGVVHFLKSEHVYQASQKYKNITPLEKRRHQFDGERRAYF